MIAAAIGFGILSGFAGLLLSFHASLPAGPAIVLTAGAVYLVSLVLGPQGGLLWLAWPRRHLEA
jgi:zinc/manganese transport system permease protein